MRRTRERSRPERRNVGGPERGLQSRNVAFQGLEMREQMVGEQNGLGALEVRVTGEDEVSLELHIARDLPEPALDRRVHVLVGKIPGKLSRLDLLEHHLESPYQLHRFFPRNDPTLSEHPGVGDRASNVVGSETYVEGDGGVESFEGF